MESGSTVGAIGQGHLPVATVKQTTELALVKAVDQLTQRLEQLEETARRKDTAMQSRTCSW